MSPIKKKLLAAAEAAEAEAAAAMSKLQDTSSFEARAAAARAYALSGEKQPLPSVKKAPPQPQQGFLTTPPVRPTPPPRNSRKAVSSKQRKRSSPPTSARRKISSPMEQEEEDDDDDYAKFVKSLDLVSLPPLPNDDDEEEYQILDDESDEDEEDVETDETSVHSSPIKPLSLPPLHLSLQDSDFENSLYSELEAELGGLLEEDLEAALHVLGTTPKSPAREAHSPPPTSTPPCTPLRESSRGKVSSAQRRRLSTLLENHYQLLIQQAVLAVRAAHKQKTVQKESMVGGETADDLAEILDGAVGMLQDLNQNRKDAIRNSIQLETSSASSSRGGKRSLLPMLEKSTEGERRLTRSAFEQTLNSHDSAIKTTFHVKGLALLSHTFSTIDKSVSGRGGGVLDQSPKEACMTLLQQAGARVEERMLPGVRDLSEHLSRPNEVLGAGFTPPLSKEQESQLKKNRNQFTAAEDNLVLRGVNLYGEKQWLLIADRYLPDRSVNIISQRYSKLCLLLYKAHGVHIDAEGNLETPPKNKSLENLDEEALSKLKKVEPPAILNVHRWSLEEDMTLLKAVPLLGNMWAELSTRFIPHRDRGHLRKRYQVLERRVKATVQRAKKTSCTESTATASKRQTASKPATKPVTAVGRKRTTKTGSDKMLPHPGAPQYFNRLPNRMPNGLMPQPGKTCLIRKPGFQLPVRGTQLLLNAAANPHFAAGVQKGSNLQKPGDSHVRPDESGYQGALKSKYDSLPAASSPELDATAEASSKQDVSRTGFEKILDEGTNDWSQMPRIKKMMENETESMVASAIVSNLANAGKESGATVGRLPQIEVDSTTSSGFSVLNTGLEGSPSKPVKACPNSSIMASVFERTKKSGANRPEEEKSEYFREVTVSAAERSPLHVPSTPSRHSLFAVPTTPIGFSPGPKSTFLSPAGFRSGFTPTGKTGFTPTGNSIMWNAPSASSTDGFELFEISDRSRQAIESNGAKPPPQSHPMTPNTNLFADGHSLMANDFEAISALNSLSNSPARSLLMKRPNPSDTAASSNSEKNGGEKPSFFAKAIGGIHDKESKKRRVA